MGRHHARLTANLPRLARDVWRQYDHFLGPEGKSWGGRGRLARALPPRGLRGVRVGRLLLRYALAALRVGLGLDAPLRLPVRGAFAQVRRSGAVKVLDLDGGQVYTLMPDPADADKLRRRFELSRRVEGFAFAPRTLEVDFERNYYSEEYFEGGHSTDFGGCGAGFGHIYLPLLVDFALAFEPRPQRVGDYADALRSEIRSPASLLRRLPDAARARVERWVERSHAHLAGSSEALPRILSHGDFFSGNVVLNDDANRAIDWAHLGFRAPLHDICYLFMNHCVRVLEPPDLERRLRAALGQLRSELGRRDPERFARLDGALRFDATTRHLFYLECIHTPLTRCDDPDDRYVAAMLERVAWFEAFERAVGDAGPEAVAV